MITDFKKKAQLFNIFFSKQCSLIPNNSSVNADVNYITDKRLSTVTLLTKDIQNPASNKAHLHDNLSLRMLKICGDSICVQLQIIFKQALVCFLLNRKKGSIVPNHKTGDTQNIKNIP